MKTYKDYVYLYETHLHTNEGSACAKNNGYEMAKAAKEYGYSGIIVTEHNWGGNTCVDNSMEWSCWVDEFAKGYYNAKKFGDENDLTVMFGYEAGYDGTEFLIYGPDINWLKMHSEIKKASVEKQYEIIHKCGGYIVHAHPFREEYYIPEIRLFPNYVDAVEGINATHSCKKSTHHNDPEADLKACKYANDNKLPITAGSDIHNINIFGGGVLFRKKINDIKEYIEGIKSGDYVLTNGDHIFDIYGKMLE